MEPTDAAAGDPGHGKRMSGRVYTTLVNVYLHKSEAEIEALHTHAPIVHVLYYHSKHGAANLAHFGLCRRSPESQLDVYLIVRCLRRGGVGVRRSRSEYQAWVRVVKVVKEGEEEKKKRRTVQ